MKRRKPWTEEDLNYLSEKWGELSAKRIAKKLKRSVVAVQLKARREGMDQFILNVDGITLNQLAKLMGISYRTVRDLWIDKLHIPYRTKIISQERPYRYICLDDFWEWAFENQHYLDFSKLEHNILGREPDWLKEKRRVDVCNAKFTDNYWDDFKDNLLKNLLNQYCYTYPEIAKRVGKTEASIKMRISELQLMIRPIPSERPCWTVEEVDKMIEMKNKGYDNNVIAETLCKTAMSVETKFARLKKDPCARQRMKFLKWEVGEHGNSKEKEACNE